MGRTRSCAGGVAHLDDRGDRARGVALRGLLAARGDPRAVRRGESRPDDPGRRSRSAEPARRPTRGARAVAALRDVFVRPRDAAADRPAPLLAARCARGGADRVVGRDRDGLRLDRRDRLAALRLAALPGRGPRRWTDPLGPRHRGARLCVADRARPERAQAPRRLRLLWLGGVRALRDLDPQRPGPDRRGGPAAHPRTRDRGALRVDRVPRSAPRHDGGRGLRRAREADAGLRVLLRGDGVFADGASAARRLRG